MIAMISATNALPKIDFRCLTPGLFAPSNISAHEIGATATRQPISRALEMIAKSKAIIQI